MEESDQIALRSLANDTTLLWIAGAAGVLMLLFVGVLVVDYFKQRRHNRRMGYARGRRETLWAKVRKPFEQIQAVRDALEERSRRNRQRERDERGTTGGG
jgi:hypothetical protein